MIWLMTHIKWNLLLTILHLFHTSLDIWSKSYSIRPSWGKYRAINISLYQIPNTILYTPYLLYDISLSFIMVLYVSACLKLYIMCISLNSLYTSVVIPSSVDTWYKNLVLALQTCNFAWRSRSTTFKSKMMVIFTSTLPCLPKLCTLAFHVHWCEILFPECLPSGENMINIWWYCYNC